MKTLFIVQNENDKERLKEIVHDDEQIFLINDSKNFFKDLFKLARKNKGKKIVSIFGNKINFFYRKKGTWVSIDDETFDYYWMREKNIKPNIKDFSLKIFNRGKRSDEVELIDGKIKFSDSLNNSLYKEKINFYLSDSWKNILDKFHKKNGYSKSKTFLFKINSKNLYDTFLNKIRDNSKIKGIDYKSYFENDEYFVIKTTKSDIVLSKKWNDNGMIRISIYSYNSNDIDLHYYSKGIENNIKNNIKQIVNANDIRKLKLREILLSLIGFAIFIFLSYITFGIILDPKEISNAFELMSEPNAWTRPWIYMIIFNFIISFFFTFFVTLFTTVLITRKKPNSKQLWTYFIASQIRVVVIFITGESIIGTILWGYYIQKNSDIRTSSLVSNVANIAILRGVMIFVIGLVFMGFGQNYTSQLFNKFGEDKKFEYILFTTLAWGGFVYALIHNFAMSIIVYMPPIHWVYNWIYTNIAIKRNPENTIASMEAREMSIRNLKKSAKRTFENRERILRIFIIVGVMLILEALETTYIFNMVQESNQFSNFDYPNSNGYWNFMQISGARTMSGYVYHFPLVSILPGGGIGPIEFFMKNINSFIFLDRNGFDDLTNFGIAQSFGEQTAFITRFFNVYLRRILSFGIVTYVIGAILFRYIRKRKS